MNQEWLDSILQSTSVIYAHSYFAGITDYSNLIPEISEL
jgi:hypothetical protein